MRKILSLTATLFLFYFHSRCQQTFEKLFASGGQAFGASVIQVLDSEYTVLWAAESTIPFGHNFFQLRIDDGGDSLWQKSYCGVYAKKIILLSDSNLITCATSYCSGNSNDILLQKMNYQGDTIWTKTYGYANPEFVQDMDTIKDGFVLLSNNTGTFPSFFKTDSAGNFISSGWGYTFMESPDAIKATLDGGYVIVGWYGTIPNCWTIEKYDSAGIYQWGKTLGNSSSGFIDFRFRDVIQLPDSDFIVCGFYPLTLAKFNHLTGDTIWTRTISYNLCANSLSYTPDGNIIIAANNKITKYDTGGNQLWLRVFPNTDLYSIKPTSDGGYIACGAYYPIPFSTLSDVVVIKTDSLGNVSSLIGIDENNIALSNSNVFPNPVTNTSQLSFLNPKNETWHFSVSDITGRVNEEKEITGSTVLIEKGNKPKGVYFYSLFNTKTGERMNGKFVVN